VKDALAEVDAAAICEKDPERKQKIAAALEASSELRLYLRYIATDFDAIDDLAALPPDPSNRASPAHFTPAMRDEERSSWREHGLETRSYATLGRCPFRFEHGGTAPRWDFKNPRTWPNSNLDPELSKGTEVVYRSVYRACAGGPFRYPPNTASAGRLITSNEPRQVEVWDNDGIVNTASSLWPNGEETILVPGDHGDIIGHYRLSRARKGSAREYDSYDVLGSGSDFEETFHAVWRGVFEFCGS
jgi:triacylglycerol lipase